MTAALADRLRKVLETHTQRDLRADFARSDFLRDHGAELLRIVEEAERDRERMSDAQIRAAFDDFAKKHAKTLFTGTVTGHSAPFYLAIFRAGVLAARGHGGG